MKNSSFLFIILLLVGCNYPTTRTAPKDSLVVSKYYSDTSVVAARYHTPTKDPSTVRNVGDTVVKIIDHISIIYIDLLCCVTRSISCEEVAHYSDWNKVILQRRSRLFEKINNSYACFKTDTSVKSIDVRVHIENYDCNDKLINTICMDGSGSFCSPQWNEIKKNDKLYKLIETKIED